ncbi:hypothetical protein KQX64_07010 [Rhodopseudomonas palustris]|nr:hypothetical protein KQX64_07010 [Rhodopseudomonas palustris]
MNSEVRKRWPGLNVGDIVTRDGTDLHRVIGTNGTAEYAPDLIDVVCIKEPEGLLNEDGVTRDEPWTRLGEIESNLAARYTLVGDAVVHANLQGV